MVALYLIRGRVYCPEHAPKPAYPCDQLTGAERSILNEPGCCRCGKRFDDVAEEERSRRG